MAAYKNGIIELQNICKGYGGAPVLQDFSITIQEGEFVTAVGSSGSGKTTVLKLINGLIAPDSGRVCVEGEDIAAADQTQLRRRIGYVIQEIGLFPHMTVYQNIAYVPRLKRIPKDIISHKVEELARVTELHTDLLQRYPDELSGGQRQRVGIARALACEPNILLMDEPFGAVDGITRRMLQDEILRIHQELGMTIFFITHDIQEALRLGERVLVMHAGRIGQFAPPDILCGQPATPYVEELIGGRNTGLYQKNN